MHGFPLSPPVYQQQQIEKPQDDQPALSMAYSSRLAWLLSAMAMAAVAFYPAAPVSAEYYWVGDGHGWTLNYTIGWPENKTFRVDDYLVFKYPKGEYTVTEVDSQTFRECYRQGNKMNEWLSGNDTVKLDKPGRRWFFSRLDDHCDMGLKLFVDVVGGSVVPAPAPAPTKLAPAPAPETPPPSPNTTTGRPGSQAPSPSAPPSGDQSAAALSHHYKVGEAVARAAAVAGAVVAAVLM